MKWEYSSADGYLIHELCKATSLSPLLVKILMNRGMTETEQILSFLSERPISHDPFLLKDMDKAVERINRALETNERIAIFGDYDADGITATALLYSFLRSLGADVIYGLPERDDTGYGMNGDTVERFSAEGVGLVVTVDTGITAFEETELFRQKGIDVIITDHHMPRETLPSAVAVVDPHRADCTYPFKPLAGVGVAYKLVCALAEGRKDRFILDVYADMIALGSIADLVPVTGENRYFIKEGLKKINACPNEGIKALAESAGYRGKKVTVTGVAYGLAPRINAAGRVASPLRALELLLSADSGKAQEMARLLNEDNEHRRELETKIFCHAVEEVEKDPSLLAGDVLVISGENWHHGVIGIVAAKIVEKYGKPTILLTNDGTIAQGSGRSTGGFNILEAISSCADLLNKFGGHGFAAGVQMDAEKVDLFRTRINDYAAGAAASGSVKEPTLLIDSGVEIGDIGLPLVKEIALLEPYGTGNSQPTLAVTHATLLSVESVGKGKHLKILAADGTGRTTFMMFGRQPADFPFMPGDHVDIAFTVSVNLWMGKESPSLSVVDIRPSSVYLKADDSLSYYGLEKELDRDMLPVRRDFINLYGYLETCKVQCFDLYTLSAFIRQKAGSMTALKLRLILDVFAEVGILRVTVNGTAVRVKINRLKEKARLEEAATAKRYHLFDEADR